MTRRVGTGISLALVAGALFTGAGPVAAQEAAPPPAARNIVSINPFGVVAGVYSAEFERGVAATVSLGVASTLWRSSMDYTDEGGSADADVSYFSMDGKLRYYPDAALRGFSLGALVGATRLGGAIEACVVGSPCEGDSGRAWALSTGVEVDYSWALGERRNVYVVTGLGAKRLFPLERNVDVTVAYPFLRFSVGYAF